MSPRGGPCARRPPPIHCPLPPLPPPRSNSEIYNHQQLRDSKLAGVDLHSKSDSAIVGYLYQKCVRRGGSTGAGQLRAAGQQPQRGGWIAAGPAGQQQHVFGLLDGSSARRSGGR